LKAWSVSQIFIGFALELFIRIGAKVG